MLIVGISWLVFWLLIDVFNVDVLKAALINGLIFTLLALLIEGRTYWPKLRP